MRFNGYNQVADILQQFPISVIASSPSLRVRPTITSLAALLDINIKTQPDLRERSFGDNPIDNFLTSVEWTWKDRHTHIMEVKQAWQH